VGGQGEGGVKEMKEGRTEGRRNGKREGRRER